MTARKTKLLFYCQHVLGMGHLIRSLEIVRGLSDFDVCFLNGGESIAGFRPPAHIEIINLPPISSDAAFRELHATDNQRSLEQTREIRKNLLLETCARVQPEVLVIEMFPFGRRKFAFELIPLLESAKARNPQTKIVCSLRDILVSKRDQARFEDEVCRLVAQYFDLVLVHSDPRFQRLDETFFRTSDLNCPVVYTGFVAQTSSTSGTAAPAGQGEKTILVSIGGGRVGSELIHCAIKASRMIGDQVPHRLLIFTGPYMPEAEFQQIQTLIIDRPAVTLQRYTTDFLSLLRGADLSISMAGYNTSMNIIVSGTRAIVYPFTGNNDQEQTIRADKLQALGLVEVIQPHELNPERMKALMLHALSQPQKNTSAPALDLNGVSGTASALIELITEGAGRFLERGSRWREKPGS